MKRLNVRTSLPRLAVLLFMVAPPALFYGLLCADLINLPCEDDYDSVLRFLNIYNGIHGIRGKLEHIVGFQHNEYKLVLESAIFALDRQLAGNVSFILLGALGNLFVLLIFLLAVRMWSEEFPANFEVAAFAIPASLLIFQLQYAATLDWAMASLQNLPVIFFSFLAIRLVARSSTLAFACGCLCFVLAVASSGNGFFVAPVGLAMFLEQRRFSRILPWLAVGAATLAIYLHGYNRASSQTGAKLSGLHLLSHINILYALSFVGASAGVSNHYGPSVALGLLLLLLFAFAIKARYHREKPQIFYCAIFIFVTALGVSGLRSGFGIDQSLALRYRIYSNLLLVFGYFFTLDWLRARENGQPAARKLLVAATLVSLLFTLVSDAFGFRFLNQRKHALLVEMAAWEKEQAGLPVPPFAPNSNLFLQKRVERPDSAVLKTSMRLGIYQPPDLLRK